MSSERDKIAAVLADVVPHANWCDYDDKTPAGCTPDYGCDVWAERSAVADAILASDWLAERDRRTAATAVREAADEWEQEDTDAVGDWLRDRADRIEVDQ